MTKEFREKLESFASLSENQKDAAEEEIMEDAFLQISHIGYDAFTEYYKAKEPDPNTVFIPGMGDVPAKEFWSIFTDEGKWAIETNVVAWENAVIQYKIECARKLSKWGYNLSTFNLALKQVVPDEYLKELSPDKIAEDIDEYLDSHDFTTSIVKF